MRRSPHSIFAFIACLFVGTVESPAAAEPPLMGLELRGGSGLSIGGGAGMSAVRKATWHLGMLVEHAVNVEPAVSVYGGGHVELGGRMALGGLIGLRVNKRHSRFSVFGTTVLQPYTLTGVGGSLGVCRRSRAGPALCLDVELTGFFTGSDLPEQRVAGQLLVLGGIRIDAL